MRVTAFTAASSVIDIRPFMETDRAICQMIAARAQMSSYGPSMLDIEHTFVASTALEEVERRWVATLEGRAVALVDVNGHHIENLFVAPEVQGIGIGSALVEEVERIVGPPVTLTVFKVNERARRLYERLGFVVEGDAAIRFRGGSEKEIWRMRKQAPLARYDLVIFDFDGTLADSAEWMISALPVICAEFGLVTPTSREIDQMRGLSSRAILKTMRIPLWKLPSIATRMRDLSEKQAAAIPLFAGASEVLTSLHARGIKLGVASSNSAATIRTVLGPRLSKMLSFAECGIDLFGKSARLKRIAREAGGTAQRAIYIGDEPRDIESAQAAGLDSGAVLWGYAKPAALMETAPTHVFRDFDEMKRVLVEN